jgi:hypothetical protein
VAQATVAFEEPLPTFVAPLDPVVVRVRVTPPGLANAVRWQVQPLAPTADVTLDRSEGRELVFHGVSRNASGGSRSANPALGYRVTANLDGQGAVQASSLVTQDEVDVLRQEYVDYGTAFRPDRKHLGALKHPALNTGNYDVVAEEEVGTLDALLERVNAEVNRMLAERRMSATFQFEDCVTSGFRNPQRNRAVGSVAMNSRHVRGRAIDCDPRGALVAGISAQDMMCLVETAGRAAVGNSGRAFTERGAAVFLDCESPAADHVHIER